MDDPTTISVLQPPRFEEGESLQVAGISERFRPDAADGIPALWQRFMPYFEQIPMVGHVAYGVCYDFGEDMSFAYLAGVEPAGDAAFPPEIELVEIPDARYAVFTHTGHMSKLGETWMTIFQGWLPTSGYQFPGTPCYERYGEEFNPTTGMGGMEIWLPVVERG
jgi:AraC family transcriptional regulator